MRIPALFSALILWTMVHAFASGQDSQGFFLDDFQPKKVSIPPYTDIEQPESVPTVTIIVNCGDTLARVSKYIYGNNSNIYTGQMVTEPRLIEYIRNLSPNIIRYPGGNISNLFFWNTHPGKPPADVPGAIRFELIQDSAYKLWYGQNEATWTMSVDNYYSMLKKTHSTGIICVNYAYARYGTGPTPIQSAAHLAADWVRYDRGRTRFWEIGNENYGKWQSGYIIDTTLNKDGQPRLISGELYGKHFKIFADSMRTAAKSVNAEIWIGAQLVEVGGKSWDPIQTSWNSGFFKAAGNDADFFIVHSYFTPYLENSPPATILNSAATGTHYMMNYMKQLSAELGIILKPVALTEWNIFAIGSKQSCSFINGMHAALVLGELAKYKYGMACRWDFANRYADGDDHGMFNLGDEPGVPIWNPRPVYFSMVYFQKFFGDHVLNTSVESDSDIIAFASSFSSGQVGIVVVNKGTKEQTIRLDFRRFDLGKRYYWYSLTGGKDNGEFSQCVYVNGVGPDNKTGGPINNLRKIKALSAIIEDRILFSSPAYSVQYILVENKK